MAGWKPMNPMLVVNWCGHGQEFILVPDENGWCWMIPVMGEVQ